MKKITLTAAIALVLTGCSEDPKTVEFFLENPEKLKTENQRCKELAKKVGPAKVREDLNCVAVIKAKKKLRFKDYTNKGAPAVKHSSFPRVSDKVKNNNG